MLKRPDSVPDYPTRSIRESMIALGLRSEILFNRRLTAKTSSCNSIVAKEYGCKGSKVKRYMQFCEMTGQQPDARIVEMSLQEK